MHNARPQVRSLKIEGAMSSTEVDLIDLASPCGRDPCDRAGIPKSSRCSGQELRSAERPQASLVGPSITEGSR